MKLQDLAKTIRSKDAGVDHVTFDIIFDNKQNYEKVKNADVINKSFIGDLYKVPQKMITDFTYFDPACAIKFTIQRDEPSGSPGDSDIYGCQQYAPLLDVEIEI